MRIKNLKKEVEYILEVCPAARNSDTELTNAMWMKFYRTYLRQMDGEWVLPLKYNGLVASRDDIKRVRAKIQNNEGRFVPTTWDVAKKRKWQEEEWRDALGYNPELRQE